MKKFQFSLDKMLNYKDQILEKEKNTLAQLRADRNAVEQKMAYLAGELAALGDRRNERTSQGITVFELQCLDFQMDSARRQIEELRVKLLLAEKAIERQLQVVVQASQEVSSLDKLKEKQLEDYRYQEARSEELVIAELICAGVIRQKNA